MNRPRIWINTNFFWQLQPNREKGLKKLENQIVFMLFFREQEKNMCKYL